MAAEARRLRVAQALSFTEMARRSGLDAANVFRLLNGPGGGTLKSWFAVAHALGCPLGDLVARLDDPWPSDHAHAG